MNIKMLKAAVAGLFLSVSGFANAGLIIEDSTDITSDSEEYINAFNLTETSYENIFMELIAKGDYGGNSPFEYIELYIDGNLLAKWDYSTIGISVTENYAHFDYTLSGVVSISDALWTTISADNILNVTWKNSSEVHFYPTEGGPDYVNFSLQGDLIQQVPEPSTLAIFALGIIGLASRRFKKQ